MKINVLSLIMLLVLIGCQASGGGAGDVVNGHVPQLPKFTLSTTLHKTYTTAQDIDFVLTFPATVTVTGSPELYLTLGSTPRIATYIDGSGTNSLLFRYTVAGGDDDSNGISVNTNINLNGGTLTYTKADTTVENCRLDLTIPSLATVKVDTVAPTLVSVTGPTPGTYYLSQNLIFTANFSEVVLVSGTPRIAIDVGGVTKYATYLSGTNSSALQFRYTVTSTDSDIDGISVSTPLDLNGGAIKDSAAQSSSLTFSAPNTSAVLVAGANPIVTTVTPPTNGTYTASQILDFTLTFNKVVNVTGSPRLALTIGSTTKYANYLMGSGTTSLKFRYNVVGGDVDNDGIALSSTIDMNSGSIQDGSLNNAVPLIISPNLSGVKIFTTAPTILSITIPSSPPINGYDVGQHVDFVVNFSEVMTETGGNSRLRLDVGGVTKYANYQSGSGSSSFIYRYTVGANLEDLNGLTLLSPLELNGSTISNSGSLALILTYSVPITTTLKVDSKAPTIVSNTKPANGSYMAGQDLDFDVTFSEPVIVSGTPRITLDVGGVTKYANYLSGSATSVLKFRYVVASPDTDTDGISVTTNIDLNSGSIADPNAHSASLALPTTATSGVLIDSTVPVITSVTPPANGTYSSAQNLNFTVNWNENVIVTGTPRLSLVIGNTTKYATYVSGSGSNALFFRYTTVSGDDDADGIVLNSPIDLNSGTIKDAAANPGDLTFTAPNTSGIMIGSSPVILSVTLPPNGTYKTGQNVDFTVVFSEAVVVTPSPRIALTLGSGTVYANYVSGGGTNSLLFRYTVAANDYDADGLAMTSPIELNSGAIQNLGMSHGAVLTYTLPNTSGILIDGIDIVISSITYPADATYKIAQNMDFTVNFNSAATVTGTPRIQLTVGAATLYATYVSGSGTATHIYRYTVGVGDLDTDGITVISNIDLNGGTIKDPFGDNATVTFTGATYANKKVDGVRPTISSANSVTAKTYIVADNMDFTLNFSEAVTITGSPRIVLTVGTTTRYATYLSGSGSTAIIFRYTVPVSDLDTNGVAIANANMIDANGGTIADPAGNAMTNFLFTPPALTSVLVDGVVPSITGITSPTYYHGKSSNIDFTVTYSEAVTVTGTPTLSINVGGASKTASYISGSGTISLVFRYTTVLNDSDTDGVATVSPLTAGGSMKDASGNNAGLTFTNATLTGVQVDAVPPTISSITLPSDAAYKNTAMTFTVVFNETVTVSGSPQLQLVIGANTRNATYVSGSGSTSLVFTYTPTGTDLDLDGIKFGNSNNLDLNGGSIKDARLNVANLGLGSNDLGHIFSVLTSMVSWYDINDSTHITVSGSVVTDIEDKISSYDLSHSSSGATYNDSGFGTNDRASITCNTGSSFTSPSMKSPSAVVSVFQSPNTGSTSQRLMYLGNTSSRPALIFSSTSSSGKIDFGGASGAKFASGMWSGNATTQSYMWSPDTIMARGFYLTNTQTRSHTICQFAGQLSEMIFFNSKPLASEMNAIEAYINSKYGLSFP